VALHDQFVRFGNNAKGWMLKCVLMLPQIDRKRIWELKGYESIYEYARMLAGMSRNKVNDSLRILYKIEDKPHLMEVVKQKGLNSVRPIITIVTKESDNYWANKAREMSKNTLITFVRDYKKENENGSNKLWTGTGSPIDNSASKPSNFQKGTDERVQLSIKIDKEIFESASIQTVKKQVNIYIISSHLRLIGSTIRTNFSIYAKSIIKSFIRAT